MIRVMFGTPVNIPNYEGTCLNCGGHIHATEIRGIFISENTTNFSKKIKVTSNLYCPGCHHFVGYVELYSAWEPHMLARCN